jgi:hypothetical protein
VAVHKTVSGELAAGPEAKLGTDSGQLMFDGLGWHTKGSGDLGELDFFEESLAPEFAQLIWPHFGG